MSIFDFFKNRKIEIGIFLIILNIAIGLVSKLPFFELLANPHDFVVHPIYYLSAIIAYLFSWAIGIVGVFMVGKETYAALQAKMQKSVHDTYQQHVGRHVDLHVKPKVKNIVEVFKGKKK